MASSLPLPLDRHGRPLGVLRLSLTARCNLACPYCLPEGQEPAGLLNREQRLRLIRAAVVLGVRCLRLTGGEPLLHGELEALIAQAAALPDLEEIALTSNGSLLSAARARALKAAGLDRITLSLDGAEGASVARMAGLADPAAGERLLAQVLAAIEHARAAGFDPARGQLKLNAVIQRGANDDQLLPLAALARQRGVPLRLIEFMDVGSRNGWRPERVVSAAEMVERIGARWPLEPQGRPRHGTASHWRYREVGLATSRSAGGGDGSPGSPLAVVASVSEPFCGDCNRLRVTADGIAFACLFASPERGLDLRPWLDPAVPEAELLQALRGFWQGRDDRWSEQRHQAWQGLGPQAVPSRSHAEMAYLGG